MDATLSQIEAWLSGPRVIAYPFPFGSRCLGDLAEIPDEELRGWPIGHLRDQAVAVDMVWYEWRGRLLMLRDLARMLPECPALQAAVTRILGSLERIEIQQRRLGAILRDYRQPRQAHQN